MKKRKNQAFSNLRALAVASVASIIFSCSKEEVIVEGINATVQNEFSLNSVKLPILSGNLSASSSHSNYPVENVLDGKLSTRWTTNENGARLEIDLGRQDFIDYIKMSHYRGANRVYKFNVYTKATLGEEWTVVGSKTSPGNTNDLYVYDLSNSVGRYILIESNGNSANNWSDITELEVFGTVGESIIDTPITPSKNGTFTLDDFQIETSWFTGEDSRTTQSFDPYETIGEEWYDKDGDTYWLKSLKTDGNRTEWKEYSGKEAPLSVYKNMQYSAKFTEIPEHGVTIAQVHNRGGVNRPLLRVYIHDDHKVWVKVTETTPDETTSTYTSYEGPDYIEGTNLKVQVLIENEEIVINVETTDGNLNESIIPSSDWDDYSESYYLKAGVYTEGNDTFVTGVFDYFVVEK